jgi:hypothetical protein
METASLSSRIVLKVPSRKSSMDPEEFFRQEVSRIMRENTQK